MSISNIELYFKAIEFDAVVKKLDPAIFNYWNPTPDPKTKSCPFELLSIAMIEMTSSAWTGKSCCKDSSQKQCAGTIKAITPDFAPLQPIIDFLNADFFPFYNTLMNNPTLVSSDTLKWVTTAFSTQIKVFNYPSKNVKLIDFLTALGELGNPINILTLCTGNVAIDQLVNNFYPWNSTNVIYNAFNDLLKNYSPFFLDCCQ